MSATSGMFDSLFMAENSMFLANNEKETKLKKTKLAKTTINRHFWCQKTN